MNRLDTVVSAGIRWHVAPAGNGTLTADSLDLARHLESGAAQVVKTGPHRTVYRVPIQGACVFWKHCRISGLRGWLRQCLRPPKARMEFDHAVALAALGVPTVEPLAWGVREGQFAGESFLITRELQGAHSLQQYLQSQFESRTDCDAPARRNLARALGQFVAKLHESGVVHPDLHPGNILVVEVELSVPRFHLIDLHSIQLNSPLSWSTSRENLIILNRWFAIRSSRCDRLRFWRHYASARSWDAAAVREWARDLERLTVESNHRFWLGRDQRCLGSNRYYRRIVAKHSRGFAVREMDEAALEPFLSDPDHPFQNADRLLKDSRTSTVAEIVVSTPEGPRAMVWKRFRVKKLLTPLLNRVRRSPALRSWQLGHALLHRNLPTARPWLVLHRRGPCGPGEGYLLCQKIDNARELPEVVASCPRGMKRRLIDELARLIRQFHEAGLSHRDLKSANILWSPGPSGCDVGHFHFIDLVGVRRHRRVTDSQRIRDLTRLNVSFLTALGVSAADRLRFLCTYRNWGLRGRADWKTWWLEIRRRSQAKVERNRRVGRALS